MTIGAWRTGYCVVNGFKQFYRDWQPPKEQHPPVLALHGSLTQSGASPSSAWRGIVRPLPFLAIRSSKAIVVPTSLRNSVESATNAMSAVIIRLDTCALDSHNGWNEGSTRNVRQSSRAGAARARSKWQQKLQITNFVL